MLASTLKRYLTGTSGDEKYLGQVPHRYLEQKSLKLLQSIKPLQEGRVGVMPSLKKRGSFVNPKKVSVFCEQHLFYREEPVVDWEAQIVIVQFHKSRPGDLK